MSFFLGGGKKVKPQYTGLALQTSASNLPITLLYGTNRVAPNIFWQGDFKAHKVKQKAGKGGGSVTSYTYSGSYQLGLCWGEINNVIKVWKDQSKETSFAKLGFSLFKGVANQAPWGYLTSKHPTEALGYPHIAHLDVANYDLGGSNALGQHSFEVQGLKFGSASWAPNDADIAVIIDDFLNNPIYGAWTANTDSPINEDTLFSGPDASTTGDAAFQTYCRAMGFALSPPMSDQDTANNIIARWTKLCNTALVYTGYDLRFIPYDTQSITGNGVTYLPDTTVRYSLSDNDFITQDNGDPIMLKRVDPADAYNSVKLTIRNRANEYNEVPAEWRDQGLIDQYGLRTANDVSAIEICIPEMGAVMAAMIGQRVAYIRNTFLFMLGPEYCLIEPMDILECYDPRWGFFFVRVTTISESDDDEVSFEAEEYSGNVSSVPGGVSIPGIINEPVDTNVSSGPINPPVIFEPPSSLAGAAQVWAAVSGGDGTTADPNWGGCFVWLSTDDITFNQIGEITDPARQGKLSAILATYGGTNPDTAHTLEVDMAMSEGELSDAVSPSDAANGVTLSYVDGELLGYENATLTGSNAYDLTNLYRGLYGSTIGAHAVGGQFARLDTTVFKYNLPPEYIGVPLYLKFQSYNIFGQGVEDLSTVTVYTITPTGAGYGTGAGGLPATPTGFSGSAGAGYAKLTWNANVANDNVTGYEVWRATGASQPFGSAARLATTTGIEYTDTSGTWGTAYTYFVVAVNAVGSSAPTAGINLTSTQPTITTVNPYGFAFGPRTPVASKILAAFDTPIAWTMPASLTNSQARIVDSDTATAAAPSAQTDFDIQSPAGASIATMRFASGSLTATFINATGDSIAIGGTVYIVAPSNLNGITGAITGSLLGTR